MTKDFDNLIENSKKKHQKNLIKKQQFDQCPDL